MSCRPRRSLHSFLLDCEANTLPFWICGKNIVFLWSNFVKVKEKEKIGMVLKNTVINRAGDYPIWQKLVVGECRWVVFGQFWASQQGEETGENSPRAPESQLVTWETKVLLLRVPGVPTFPCSASPWFLHKRLPMAPVSLSTCLEEFVFFSFMRIK